MKEQYQGASFGPGSRKPSPSVSAASGFDPSRFAPLPMEAWEKLPEREQRLQSIGDVIAYWLRWVTREHEDEGCAVTPDTYIMLGYENAPPHWPSVGQLAKWLEVLRDSDGSGEAGETALAGSTEGDSAGPKDIAQ